jgi:hypothetical protein
MAATVEKPRRRWFRLTPDRCVLGLLILEGFLLPSAWFRWFPFDQHKVWTVLIAIASVGVAILLMFLWFLFALVFRLRFQFSILSLLLLVVVVAIPFSWLAPQMQQARQQREAVEVITKAGGRVSYDYECDSRGNWILGATPPGPGWLHRLLGEDLFVNVTKVDFRWVVTKRLPPAQQFGDAGVEYLEQLPRLQGLYLRGTKISDAGLRHLTGLSHLQELDLGGTEVSDAGLRHLTGLTQLQQLDLGRTRVGDAGLECLEHLTQLQELYLDDTTVGVAGLRHLKGLTQLRFLNLVGTKVRHKDARGVFKLLPSIRNMAIL